MSANKRMVTFDPTAVFMLADLAATMKVSRSAALGWMNTHLAKGAVPPPIFTLTFRDGRTLRVWTSAQGAEIVALYRSERADQ